MIIHNGGVIMAKISIQGDIVTVTQSTKTINGINVELTQNYDFTNTSKHQLMQWAAANRVIAWRAHNDVKNLTERQTRELPTDIDCTMEFESVRKPKAENTLLYILKEQAARLGITPEALLAQMENISVKQ